MDRGQEISLLSARPTHRAPANNPSTSQRGAVEMWRLRLLLEEARRPFFLTVTTLSECDQGEAGSRLDEHSRAGGPTRAAATAQPDGSIAGVNEKDNQCLGIRLSL